MHALDTMRTLASEGDIVRFEPGEAIFRAGEMGATMFGILEGSVRLSWNGNSAYEEIGEGSVFGAGALVMEEHTRFGTAVATTKCRLLEMDREKFLFAVQETPMFAIQLIASLDERLRSLKRRLQSE
jgi:CRP-like cAMP-binding protein